MAVDYTNPELVSETKVTDVPVSGQTVTGYGGSVPTRHMVQYSGAWRRVYMMQYGNSGTPYVKVHGTNLVLDSDTQHKLNEI